MTGDEALETHRNGGSLAGADLMGVELSGADLSGADLVDANLEYANLSGVKLVGADLRFAVLTNANLLDADLSNANLREADLSDARLDGAKFVNANLVDTVLSEDLDPAALHGRGHPEPASGDSRPSSDGLVISWAERYYGKTILFADPSWSATPAEEIVEVQLGSAVSGDLDATSHGQFVNVGTLSNAPDAHLNDCLAMFALAGSVETLSVDSLLSLTYEHVGDVRVEGGVVAVLHAEDLLEFGLEQLEENSDDLEQWILLEVETGIDDDFPVYRIVDGDVSVGACCVVDWGRTRDTEWGTRLPSPI